MFRIGRMIRSAKIKATTPPKLMPPFHITAASGPISGPTAWRKLDVRQEEGLPERVRHPNRERARNQEAADDVEPDGGPIHHEIVVDRGETSVGGHPLPKR